MSARAPAPSSPLLAPSNIRAWMLATPFTQCAMWSSYVDHMLGSLSAVAPTGAAPTEEDIVWLRQLDADSDNSAWVVCNRLDPGAVPFTRNDMGFL